jgi:hypothetical protein
MQTGFRIQDDPGTASRYLAGRLSPAELPAYEQHLLEHPEAVDELEATARMKVGLANLRDTGQLAAMLRAPATVRWPALALGSAVAAAIMVIAVGMWRGGEGSRDTPLVATASELLDSYGQPLASGASYALLPTRSSGYDAVIELPPAPRAIELRVRPDAPAAIYKVSLSRVLPDGAVTPIGNASELSVATDGFVPLYVDSSRLESGPYELAITPAQPSGAASTTEFRVKVTAPRRDDRVPSDRW